MNSLAQDKRIRVPKTDLKKKPTAHHLKVIAKQSASKNHPFNKVKEPKKEKIEEIFIKSKKDKKTVKKKSN
tara:strand:- start:761 stop:973 length:213 start_codon:yes stop_codon:yes gene_type:complete